MEHFKILVAAREEDDLEEIKMSTPFLEEHWDAFEVFSVPEEIGCISSSSFREMLRRNDPAAQLLVTDGVWNILNEAGKIPWNTVSCFREEYFYLSNFYETQVAYGGFTYGSSEAAFQAQKCMTEEEKLPFTEAAPSQSKKMGSRVRLHPDWEHVKTGIMKEIVRAKFCQNQELAQRLMATGEKIIVEGNTWGDVCWGVDTRTGKGENRLGRILMEVRAELNSRQASA